MKLLKIIIENCQFLITKVWYSFYKRNKDVWAFGEWGGNRCCDNCMYFANYLAESHPEIGLFWITKPSTDLSRLDRRVKVVVMDSKEAAMVLKRAGAVFFAHTLNDITYRHSLYYSGALIVNFWHGVPWKKIGLDMPLSRLERIYVRYRMKTLEAHLYLSTSKLFTKVFGTAFECKTDEIITAGYPRNSIFYSKEKINNAREHLFAYLVSKGNNFDKSTKVILYMPTFRDKCQDVFSFDSIMDDERLKSLLENHNAIIIQKAHFVTSQRSQQAEIGVGRFFQATDFPSQELLAVADILVTDYSSCFFDYLILDRPVLHYLYDYEYYADKDRGLYYPKEDAVCGDVAQNEDQLIDNIAAYLINPKKDHELRVRQLGRFLEYETPHACQEIYAYISKKLG